MEESGNKGLGSTMQSDTSLDDSALKWWDGCEANTLPFNEGLFLAPFSSLLFLLFCTTENKPAPLLPFLLFASSWLTGEGGRSTEHTETHLHLVVIPHCLLKHLQLLFSSNTLCDVHTGPRPDLLVTVVCGW